LFALALLFAVQAGASVGSTDAGAVTQAKLDRMTQRCNAPRSWLKHLGGNRVHVRPSCGESFKQIDCVLSQLKNSGLPMDLGFVGNEAPANGLDH